VSYDASNIVVTVFDSCWYDEASY